MSEHKIQNEGRNALAIDGVFCARANVGKAWTGNEMFHIRRPGQVTLQAGDVVIRNARPFDTGLPNGFSDTLGVSREIVTQDMVGKPIGVAFFVEYKDIGKQPTPTQRNFLTAMQRLGARSGVAYSADDAVAIALGRKT